MGMKFSLVENPPWDEMSRMPDHTLFQSKEWIVFVAEAQNAQPVIIEIADGSERIGWFVGLIVKKIGLRILGSPFPGWTTSYMGFNLHDVGNRTEALGSLIKFSRKELGCVGVEVMDRKFQESEITAAGWRYRLLTGYEVDLSGTENDLFDRFSSSTQRNIRKSEREGISVVQAHEDSFIAEYYSQLQEVFALQGLKPTYTKKRVELLLKHLLPTGRLLLLRVLDPGGKCIASGIFPADQHRMYFWGGASRTESRILRPNEAMHWFAMKYWQGRGVALYDMGGGGEYKRKYGGRPIAVPWIRHSHIPGFEMLRSLAKRLVEMRQRF